MAAVFITSTPAYAFNALRCQNALVLDSYEQLKAMIARSLSPQHALLFAEPAWLSTRESIDWYTEAQGPITPLQDLPAAEQEHAKRAFSSLAADILTLAEKLLENGNPTYSVRGKFLQAALHYPGLEYLYMVGQQPVCLAWGATAGDSRKNVTELVKLGYFGAPAPVAAPNSEPAAQPPLATTAPAPRPVPLPPAPFSVKKTVLALLAGVLVMGIAGAAYGISVGPKHPFFTQLPEKIQALYSKEGLDLLAQKEKDTVLSLTEDKSTGETLTLQAEKARENMQVAIGKCVFTPPFAQGAMLHIPQESQRKKDVRFLKGCWESQSTIINSKGDLVTISMCFDAQGKGEQTIQSGTALCKGPVRAFFEDAGTLMFEEAGATCQQEERYEPAHIICQQQNNTAKCYGRNTAQKQEKWGIALAFKGKKPQ